MKTNLLAVVFITVSALAIMNSSPALAGNAKDFAPGQSEDNLPPGRAARQANEPAKTFAPGQLKKAECDEDECEEDGEEGDETSASAVAPGHNKNGGQSASGAAPGHNKRGSNSASDAAPGHSKGGDDGDED